MQDDLATVLDIVMAGQRIALEAASGPLTTEDMMRLTEYSGTFDFWNDPGEAIYSLTDGEPI